MLIKEVEGMDLYGHIKNPVAAVAGNAKVDVLVVGHVVAAEDGMMISYRALDMKGGILATTGQQFIEVNADAIGGMEAITFDAALKEASQVFAKFAPDMEVLQVRGVNAADTFEQTSFGSYVVQQFGDVHKAAVDDSLTSSSLHVMAGTSRAQRPGTYALWGNYWDLGSYVHLRLALGQNSSDGESMIWSGKILKSSISSELEFVPAMTPALADQAQAGDLLDMELSSNKGINPVYQMGEYMVLQVRLDQDAYVHCYYHQSNGTTIRIFPNMYRNDALVRGGVLQKIPSSKMPFQFKIEPPAGVDRVRCFAMDRNVQDQLPKPLARMDLSPIAKNEMENIDQAYRSIHALKVSEVEMDITIEAR